MTSIKEEKKEEIPEVIHDPQTNSTYQRLRFFGKVSFLTVLFTFYALMLSLIKINHMNVAIFMGKICNRYNNRYACYPFTYKTLQQTANNVFRQGFFAFAEN